VSIRERITERQKARAEIERDVKAYLAANPDASRQKITSVMRSRWREKYGASPWLELLLQLLPLILKIFGL
jgi:hypothetical protein